MPCVAVTVSAFETQYCKLHISTMDEFFLNGLSKSLNLKIEYYKEYTSWAPYTLSASVA